MVCAHLNRHGLNVARGRPDTAGLLPLLPFCLVTEEQPGTFGRGELGVVAALEVKRQQIVTVLQDDRLVAHHHALLADERERVRPRPRIVAGHFGLDSRSGPGRAVAHDVKQPGQAVGRLPDHRVSQRTKRIMRDADGRCPLASALFPARAEHAGVRRVFVLASVVDNVEVAVPQFLEAGGMLVGAGPGLGAEQPLDAQLAGVQRRRHGRAKQPGGNGDRRRPASVLDPCNSCSGMASKCPLFYADCRAGSPALLCDLITCNRQAMPASTQVMTMLIAKASRFVFRIPA